MKKLVAIISGLGGLSILCVDIYGLVEISDRSIRIEDVFFISLFFIAGTSALYTSVIAWNLLNNRNEESILTLKAKKTRLLLEKEIRELETEKKEIASKDSN